MTVPRVPTGINAGVSNDPCAVVTFASLAFVRFDRAEISKRSAIGEDESIADYAAGGVWVGFGAAADGGVGAGRAAALAAD